MRILETGNTTHEMVAIKGNMPNPTVNSFEYNFPFIYLIKTEKKI